MMVVLATKNYLEARKLGVYTITSANSKSSVESARWRRIIFAFVACI